MRQSDAEDSAWLGVLRAARLEIVHDAQHMSPAVQHRAAFTGNPPRFHAAIEQWRLQCRFEALDLPCDRRGRQEQPLGCPQERPCLGQDDERPNLIEHTRAPSCWLSNKIVTNLYLTQVKAS